MGAGFGVLGFRVFGFGALGFRVLGLGFRVSGLRRCFVVTVSVVVPCTVITVAIPTAPVTLNFQL